MAYQLDAKFFRKAKKVNRAVELTDTHAIIPAVKDSPEIRVTLPNRRIKTVDERIEGIDARFTEISELEEEIETERKRLMDLIQTYKSAPVAGVAEIVVQNLKVENLMDRRRTLRYPESWIESIPGLSLVDVFASKRDVRKLDGPLYQVKNRVEPIESLYVDLGAMGAKANIDAEAEDDKEEILLAVPKVDTVQRPAAAPTAEERAKGATIASAKKAFKLKATGAKAPSGGGGGP